MSREFHFSIVSVPSRILSVATLLKMGVEFPTLDTDPHLVLAEVRPEMGRPPSDGPGRPFVATAKVEEDVYRARFETTPEWFLEQIPMSILLNIPDDLSAVA